MKNVLKRFLSVFLAITIIFSSAYVGLGEIDFSGVFAFKVEAASVTSIQEFNGHYYRVYDESLSWTNAKIKCEELGGHLVTITSQEEQDFLIDLVISSTKKNLWIGANADSNGVYCWVTGEPFSFTNWASGEPNNVFDSQYNAMMYTQNASYDSGLWNDENGNGRNWSGYYLSDFGFVCEWESSKKANVSALIFTLSDDSTYYSVTGCETSAIGEVVIPDTYKGLPVTSIGEEAFCKCAGLNFVTIPESVTSIGDYAFSECTGLTSVIIPDNGINIGNDVFSGCTSLVSVSSETGHTYGDWVISAEPTCIVPGQKYRSCTDCGHKESVEISAKGHFYGDWVVTVVPTCTEEGTHYKTCSSCGDVVTEAIEAAGHNFVDGYCTYCGSGIEFEYTVEDNAITITGYIGTDTNIIIPSAIDGIPVKNIGDKSFYKYTNLTSVTIPDSVTSIGELAFCYSTSLTSIKIPDSVTIIGKSAFSNCTSLKSITIPNSVTYIGNTVFYNCTGLEKVYWNAKSVDDFTSSNTFYKAGTAGSGIEIVFGDTVEKIPAYLFSVSEYKYRPKIISVTISDSVSSIGSRAFYGCYSITSVYISDLAAWCSIEFGGSSSNPLYYAGNLYINGELATDIVIPSNVTNIGNYAFYNCNNLISVTIPNSVTSIGDSAFCNCKNLTSITIPDSVINIGDDAFEDCTSLAFVEIGNGVTSIGTDAFRSCNNLTSVIIPDSVTSIGTSVFSYCENLTSVKIGNSVISVSDYAFHDCENLESVIIGDGATSIGSDAFSGCDNLTSVTIGNCVTSIGSFAFRGCASLPSIIIPDSVLSIGNCAFDGCTSLASVTIGNRVTTIGKNIFDECTSLTSVSIPDSVTSISEKAFYNCTSLTSVEIGNGVTSIGNYAFYNCTSLISITIPNSVTSIGNDAFVGCTSLSSVTIGNSLMDIGDDVFCKCINLLSINVDENNVNYSSVDGVLFNKDKTCLIQYPAGKKDTEYIIPDSVTTISEKAFYGCTNLATVTIPVSVTSIGDDAFYNCTGLKKVYWNAKSVTDIDSYSDIFYSVGTKGSGVEFVFGDTVETIPAYLCQKSSYSPSPNIISVTIGKNATSIGEDAFSGCEYLVSVIIGESVTTIDKTAFHGCTSLTSINVDENNPNFSSVDGVLFNKDKTVLIMCPQGKTQYTIPDSVTSIGEEAFYDCGKLTNVTIGENVTIIGDYAFKWCDALASVVIPNSVTTIGEDAFIYCDSLSSVTIGNGVTSIGAEAFYSCDNITAVYITDLTAWYNIVFEDDSANPLLYAGNLYINKELATDITIPDSVKSIGDYVFCYCTSLTSVTIPDSVTSIGYGAFYNCTGLISLTIGKGVTTIGERAFGGCTGLEKVYWNAKSVTDFDSSADIFCNAGTSGSGIELVFGDTVEKIPAYLCCDSSNNPNITTITIGDSVTSIGVSAFRYCKSLISVTTGDNVTSIGEDAFYYCTSLTEIVIPDSVTNIGRDAFDNTAYYNNADNWVNGVLYIGNHLIQAKSDVLSGSYIVKDGTKTIADRAFYECTGLTSVTIPDSVVSMGAYTFYECSNLTSITIPDSVTRIGEWAFHGCKNLLSITIPDGVTSIGDFTFYGCTSLTSVTIPDSVTSIGNYAFYNCKCLALVKIGNSVKSINDYAFYGCTSLTSVIIPDSVTSIGEDAFWNCTSLTDVIIGKNITSIGSAAFYECNQIKYVFYAGSESDWANITISSKNTPLTNAAIHYNSTDHTYETTVISEATCTEGGLISRACTVCDYSSQSEEIPALGHDYSTEWTIDKVATCTEDGSKSHHCSRCDSTTDVTVIVAIGHLYSDWVVTSVPTCPKEGVQKKTCSACGDVVTEVIEALGHDYSNEWTIDNAATCTEDGSKSYHCSRCDSKSEVTVIPATGHNYSDWIVTLQPTCTEDGSKKKTCSNCGDIVIETIKALGHDYSTDWTIDEAVTCTTDGIKSRHCSRCDSKSEVTVITAVGHIYSDWITDREATCTVAGSKHKACSVCQEVVIETIEALGHDYSTEWTVDKSATCTTDGSKSHHCSRCDSKSEVTVISATGHLYSDWIIDAEATVLSEGAKHRTCSVCDNKENQVIEKIEIDIETNTDYGLAVFTVVHAQTLEPISGAQIFISTENDGENTFTTDSNGQVSVTLPVGKQVVSAYAEGCLTRNLKLNIKSGVNEIPKIGLSDISTYDAEITSKLMTIEEIEAAGIDTSAPENQHVYKYELKLEFEAEIDWYSFFYYMNDVGEVVGGGSGGGSGGGYWVDLLTSGPGGYFYIPATEERESVTVYPVSEYFYLIIRGEVKWLKEMFDVEMLVINNSLTDTLEDLTATLELPEGLSLAKMVGEQQSLVQEIDHIAEGESESVHWYVRGDKEGSYNLEARLQGTIMPFEEEIDDLFIAENQLQVLAGNALKLHFEFPDAAYYGEDYPITITLTNVSDRTLYNISHMIQVEQGMVVYYSDGTSKEKVDTSTLISSGVIREFNPGDKIIIEGSVNIFFKSEMMERELEKYIGLIDGIEQLINGYKAVTAALDIFKFLDNCVTGCTKAMDDFIASAAESSDKLDLFKELHSKLSSLYTSYSTTGNKTLDAAINLANTGLNGYLNAITEDPDVWFATHSAEDIKALLADIEALENSIIAPKQPTKKFDIFDSLRTAISAIPIRFALKNVIITEDENNTTSIPWSYSTTKAGPQYFGVSNVSKYMISLVQMIGAEAYEASMPGIFMAIPGVDDPFNKDEAIKYIQATENEIAQFKAKDATGEVTFRAWVERNEASTYSLRSTSVSGDFLLESDNETATYEDGVLTFTGDGMISVTPQSQTGGTLYIEDSEGNLYTYVIDVVEQHTCTSGEREVVVSPTAEYDGFAVKCCTTCGEIMEIENLPYSNCCAEHTFGDWSEKEKDCCTDSGVRSRSCSVCGFTETEFVSGFAHNFVDGACSVCGIENTDESLFDYETSEETVTITGCDVTNGQVIIPDTLNGLPVTGIGTSAFESSEDITSIVIPDSVTSIGDSAFENCDSLEYIFYEGDESEWEGLTIGSNNAVLTDVVIHYSSTDHSYEEKIDAEATCTEEGSKHKECTVCGCSLEAEVIPAIGHDYSTEWTVDAEPTCIEEGSKSHHCSRCDSTADETVIAATGHLYSEWNVTLEPTCIEEGSQSKNCSICGEVVTEAVEVLGHDYSTEWTVDAEPTCIEEGSKSHHCSRCDSKSDTTTIPANGHSYGDWVITLEPTCTEEGSHYKICSDCEDTVTESIEILGHDFSTEWTVDSEPTCTEVGSKSHHCTRCDSKSDKTVISATGHSFGESVLTSEPTCTEDGVAERTCTVCGVTEICSEYLGEKLIDSSLYPESEHNYGTDISEIYEFIYDGAKSLTLTFSSSTCTENGWDYIYIYDETGELYGEYSGTTLAGESITLNGSAFSIKLTSDGSVTKYGFSFDSITASVDISKALGHDYSAEWTVDSEPTCTDEGSKSHHCTRCDSKTDKTTIPANGHSYGDWVITLEPTCTEEGSHYKTCSDCGDIVTEAIEALGHDYSTEWTIDVEPTCTEEGRKSYHCTRCDDKADETVIAATGHFYGDWVVTLESTCTEEGSHYKTCSVCGDTVTEAVEALGHDYSMEWIVDVEPTCTEEGSKSHHCSRCDSIADETVIEALGHDYSTEWTIDVEPSCTEEGSKSHHCTRCNDKTDITSIEVIDHTFGTWVTDVEATCTEVGEKHRECTVCGYTEDSEIPASHYYVDGYCTVCGAEQVFKYSVSNNVVTITGYTGTDTEVTIPSAIDGLPITNIGEKAFYDCDSLTSIIIPDSVTSIGNSAFYYCSNIASVAIPDSVTSIGDSAFRFCDSLTSVIIPDSVIGIGDYAFLGCDSLTSATIGANIGKQAFYNCDALTNVTIGEDVTSIGACAFGGCKNLEKVYWNAKSVNNFTLSSEIFYIAGTSGLGIKLVFGDSVETIPAYLCMRNYPPDRPKITSVTIGNNVSSIGDAAFYDCDLTEITIPDSVTTIGASAFGYCDLTEITIPDSVTSIGNGAFYYCNELTSVTIGNSVTSIGDSAFRFCDSLTSITIPDSVTSIGEETFRFCDNLVSINVDENNTNYSSVDGVLFNKDLTELVRYPEGRTDTEYIVPDSVIAIGNCAFSSCYKLTAITIPNSVTSIGEDAFYNCIGITSITFPDSLTSIGNSAFYACTNLSSATISGGVTSIGDEAFYECESLSSINVDKNNAAYSSVDGVLFNKGKTELIQYPCGKTNISYTIPDGITSIDDYAFAYSTNLVSVTIGNTVTEIGYMAFRDCDNLISVTIPNSVTSIGNYVFRDCDSLTSVTIGDGVTSIAYSAFDYCSNLTSVTIGNSVTSIGAAAFYECSSLAYVFYSGSESDWANISIESSNTPLTDATIHYNSTGHSYEEKIDTEATCTEDGSKHQQCTVCSYNLEAQVIPALGHDYSTEWTIDVEPTCTEAGGKSHHCLRCDSITDETVIEVLGHDYSTEWTIDVEPNCIEEGSKSHHCTRCDDKADITAIEVIDHTYGDWITDVEATCTETGEKYHECTVCGYTEASEVVAIGHYYSDGYCSVCGIKQVFDYSISNDVVTITGYTGTDTDVTIPSAIDGLPVTSIGEDAFYKCTSLISITIPDSVTSIGSYAFYYCTNLISVTFSDSVTSIYGYAFCGCESLTSIVIPDNVTNIGSSAFYNCTNITSLTIPESVMSIGDDAFNNCESLESIYWNAKSVEDFTSGSTIFLSAGDSGSGIELVFGDAVEKIPAYLCYISNSSYRPNITSITIGKNVASIGERAFYECTNLTSITIPDSLTSIGDAAFYECTRLTSVTIPDSVTTIGDYAFEYCDSLTSITIGDSVTSIGDNAFLGCESLTSVTIPDSVTTIGDYAFNSCTSLSLITVASKNNYYCSIDGVLFNKAKTKLIQYPAGKTNTTYIIPDNVTIIDYGAFEDCKSLASITIPDSVKKLYYEVFRGCTSLTFITIPDSVTYIGKQAFYDCTSLTSVSIPDSVTSIGDSVFYNCKSLESIYWNAKTVSAYSSSSNLFYNAGISGSGIELVFGDSVEYIPAYLCYVMGSSYAPNIVSVTIGASVTSIGRDAFDGCSNLTYVTIPDSVTSIGNYAFYNCSALDYVFYSGSESNWANISIGSSNTPLTDAAIHYNSTDHTFTDGCCTVCGLENVIVASLEPCYASSSLDIETAVVTASAETEEMSSTNIGERAFYNCPNLVSVTIPYSTASIGDDAFSGCESLADVYYPGTEEEWASITIGSNNACLTNATIHFNDICNPGEWSYEWVDKEIVITGYRGTATDIVIPKVIEGAAVIGIAENAFADNTSLNSVTIGNNVTTIGGGAFSGCTNLTIFAKPGTSAEAYAKENNITFVPMIVEAKENSENIVDYINKKLVINELYIEYLEDAFNVENGSICIEYSGEYNGIYIGSGTELTIVNATGNSCSFTCVVMNDTNGDGVCDVLDCVDVERASNGNLTLYGIYAEAGDTNSDGVIDENDYQSIVNIALAS